MRVLSISAGSSSTSGGTPGSRMCTPTSRSCSTGISAVACVACRTGRGRVSLTQPDAASKPAKRRPSADTRLMRMSKAASTSFLVATVFLPERLAQFRVRLLHRRLADLPRDDVVVLSVGDVGRNRARALAAGCAAAADTALHVAVLAFRVVARPRLAASGAGGLEATFALRPGTGLTALTRLAILAGALFVAEPVARGRFLGRRTFLGDVRLRRAHGGIECAEGLVEPPADLGAPAAATARRRARALACRAAGAVFRLARLRPVATAGRAADGSRRSRAARLARAAGAARGAFLTRGTFLASRACFAPGAARQAGDARRAAGRVRAAARSSRRTGRLTARRAPRKLAWQPSRQTARQRAGLRIDAGFGIHLVVVFGRRRVIGADARLARGRTARAAGRSRLRPLAGLAAAAFCAALSCAARGAATFARHGDRSIRATGLFASRREIGGRATSLGPAAGAAAAGTASTGSAAARGAAAGRSAAAAVRAAAARRASTARLLSTAAGLLPAFRALRGILGHAAGQEAQGGRDGDGAQHASGFHVKTPTRARKAAGFGRVRETWRLASGIGSPARGRRPQVPAGGAEGSSPFRKAASWPARRSQAVPWTRAMNGRGTSTPTRAEVPMTFVETEPAVFAELRSQTTAW